MQLLAINKTLWAHSEESHCVVLFRSVNVKKMTWGLTVVLKCNHDEPDSLYIQGVLFQGTEVKVRAVTDSVSGQGMLFSGTEADVRGVEWQIIYPICGSLRSWK